MKFLPRQIAVVGAGTMGAQIAAHLANLGFSVHLLDLPPDELTADEVKRGLSLADPAVRNRPVRALFERMRKLSPAPLCTPETASRITLGNTTDNLSDLVRADWIIEAVVERLDVKQALHTRLASVVRPDALVTTNTSGLPIHRIAAHLPPAYRRRFFATHFFNPPRYLRLLEVVAPPETDAVLVHAFMDFATRVLGKGVVLGKDTPCFIANRIGCFDLQTVLWMAPASGFTVEEIDALTGPLIGRPASATFRLCDLVGIDLIAQLSRNLLEVLPDAKERATFATPAYVATLVERGWWGEKRGQGFYRRVVGAHGREIHALDLQTLAHRAPRPVAALSDLTEITRLPLPGERVSALFAATGPAARFVQKHLARVLAYAAEHAEEISPDLVSVDRAMRWGFNWELGPFELWDAIGVGHLAHLLEKDGQPVPSLVTRLLTGGRTHFHEVSGGRRRFFSPAANAYYEEAPDPDLLSLPAIRRERAPVRENAAAALHDLGDGVACFEFRTKMHTINEETLALWRDTQDILRAGFTAVVLGNSGPHFSAGADLKQFAAHISAGRWAELERMVRVFQETASSLRQFELPVVAAVQGYTLGGGCELAMGCDHVVAHTEVNMALPELGIGLIPGAHGTKEMLVRCTEDIPPGGDPDYFAGVRLAWETLTQRKISTSGPDAVRLRFLRRGEWTHVAQRDHLLSAAKTQALRMVPGYRPPAVRAGLPAIGRSGLASFRATLHALQCAGHATEHDVTVGLKLAHVLCGGDLSGIHFASEDYFLGLEREAFLSLCGEPRTLERIGHLLKTGKPLRN